MLAQSPNICAMAIEIDSETEELMTKLVATVTANVLIRGAR